MPIISGNPKPFSSLGFGCWLYHPELWTSEQEAVLFETMETALSRGLDHFDTATGYGKGASEKLVGRFLQGKGERVFLATKANLKDETPQSMLTAVQRSLERLQVGCIDLYYIHWPRTDLDIRPAMEGLELARAQGLVRSVGVSNFSAAQMELVSQVGKIDAHQIPYSLLWRSPEQEVAPYCLEKGIGLIPYGALGSGILTGKFERRLHLETNDQRNNEILFFREPTWGAIHAAVEEMKVVAQEIGRPLAQLALRWSLSRPGVACTLVGANSPTQVTQNAGALEGDVPTWALDRLTEISDRLQAHIPSQANPYGYNP